MSFKHSLSILTSRFSITYKLIAFMLIVTLIFSVLAVCAVFPTLSGFRASIGELGLFDSLQVFAKSVLRGEEAEQLVAYEQLSAKLMQAKEIVSNNSLEINLSLTWLFILYVIYLIFFSWGQYCVSDVMNHHMSSNSKYGFCANLAINFPKAMRYSLLYVAISLGFLVALGLLFWLIFISVFKLSVYLGIMTCIAVSVFITALKRSLLFGWVPAMVADNMGVIDALRKSRELLKVRFAYALGLYVMYYIIWLGLCVAILFFTFGAGIIFSISISIVLAQVCDLVIYYRTVGKRYYIDVLNVVDPSIKQRTI